MPKIFAETDRLILRELVIEDAEGIFLLNSDPLVMQYLGVDLAKTLADSQETVNKIRKQ